MKQLQIAAKYDPKLTEDKWYAYWMKHRYFHSEPDEREPYTIVIPPPNVTGVLHMGHMLNNTIQDILVRRARMLGKNALWLPGTDHASIATEARVVAKLKEQGIRKTDLSRDEFLEHAWSWREKHGGIILEQLKKLGASCDWDRTRFTMDPEMSESVIKVFNDLHNKGYIYRGVRMVNWDPQAKTAISDEEVVHREMQSKLYYVKYPVVGSPNTYLTIATTRPETILGDTAVCVNPADPRFREFVGKEVMVPMTNRVVPVIEDDYVDMEFGTGALKITPAHDINDYEIGIRHQLPSIHIFNDDGTLSEAAGHFVGIDRFEARTLSVQELTESGNLVKTEEYLNKVGFSERTDAVIEPRLSQQWFLRMKELAEPALENVMNDTIQLHPSKFKNTYRHWMENIKDWCISRQLWWGHRIPAWYLPDGQYVVAKNGIEALEKGKVLLNRSDLKPEELQQDEDVLDTWFSSWLWPISVFDGIRDPENPDIKYYYPTNDLVTAPEILFFWVARMIIAGYEYLGDQPFKNVYLTGIVRDAQHRKMSKSLGNSPDPLDLISKYGADGVRVGMLFCSPAGNDLLFDESLTEQGRNFANKIWNAFRLVAGWEVDSNISQPETARQAVEWFGSKFSKALNQLNDDFEKYRLSEALMTVYKLFWDDFSSWYLELVKPAYQSPIDQETLNVTIGFLEKMMLVLHPFMPFITEEIWQTLYPRMEGESLMIEALPEVGRWDEPTIDRFEMVKEIVVFVRSVRASNSIPNKEQIALFIKTDQGQHPMEVNPVLSKYLNLSKIDVVDAAPEGAVSQVIRSVEYYVPLGDQVDLGAELVRLEEELVYTKGFLKTVLAKLSNQRFVDNAPSQVVETERRKQSDAEAKIAALTQQIKGLKGE